MKNNKILIWMLTLSFIGVMVYSCTDDQSIDQVQEMSLENREAGGAELDCYSTLEWQCSEGQTTLLSDQYMFFTYQGCEFKVTYDVRICSHAGAFHISILITDWEPVYTQTPNQCTQLMNNWINMLQGPLAGTAEDEINAMLKTFYDHIELHHVQLLVVGLTIPCPTPLVYSNVVQQSCYRICWELGDPITGELPFIYESKCGDICCSRTTRFCVNEGEVEVLNITYNPANPVFHDCKNIVSTCPAFRSGSCQPGCSNL
jgi:hypothetical protein